MPLLCGLGAVSEREVRTYEAMQLFKLGKIDLCPKIYTTRTHPLSGEYYVVEGSRFKAKPVEPRIEFEVTQTCELDLKDGLITSSKTPCKLWAGLDILARRGLHFPELDLGFRGATFEMLRDELLCLNQKATIDTPFFVNLLEPMRQEKLDAKK